eukprot:7381309-Prymnesium_polylepis.1
MAARPLAVNRHQVRRASGRKASRSTERPRSTAAVASMCADRLFGSAGGWSNAHHAVLRKFGVYALVGRHAA